MKKTTGWTNSENKGERLNAINKWRRSMGMRALIDRIINCLECDKKFKSNQQDIRLCRTCRERE